MKGTSRSTLTLPFGQCMVGSVAPWWTEISCLSPARRPTHRGPCSAMERVVDFLLDSAARNGLRPRSASTRNGLARALRVNTLSTASAFGWRTRCVLHTGRWRPEQQQGMKASHSFLGLVEMWPSASRFLITGLILENIYYYPMDILHHKRILSLKTLSARPRVGFNHVASE